jgi:protein-L-isoaspartate(D-aspartate) O-methyltransferase
VIGKWILHVLILFGVIIILGCEPSGIEGTVQALTAESSPGSVEEMEQEVKNEAHQTNTNDTPCSGTKLPQTEYVAEREALVDHAISTQHLEDEDVITALRNVPRHCFVTEEFIDKAYFDTALPIGFGQTISQPSLVAYMTELLELKEGDKVLEIGTGSGYQAALLAELGIVDVFSIEIVPQLYERSTQILNDLGYDEVYTKQADGYYGWLEHAPFDAIIVTAAPDHLPGPLANQLAEGGILVIPIGPQGWYQTLWKFVKKEGELVAYNMGEVVFVPFTGEGIQEPTPTP